MDIFCKNRKIQYNSRIYTYTDYTEKYHQKVWIKNSGRFFLWDDSGSDDLGKTYFNFDSF